MRNVARIVGFGWVVIVVAAGVWLGISGVLWDAPGIIFQSGFGDIWILAIIGAPGYFLWKWGGARPAEKE